VSSPRPPTTTATTATTTKPSPLTVVFISHTTNPPPQHNHHNHNKQPLPEPDSLIVRVAPADGDDVRAGRAVAASSGLEFIKPLGDGLVVLEAKDDPARASSAALALQAAIQQRAAGMGGGTTSTPATAAASLASGDLLAQAVARAVAQERVNLVEKNWPVSIQAVASECPSGTSCPGLWGMTAIRAPQAWKLVGGGGATTAPVAYTVIGSVIDTGVQYDHVELDTQLDRSLGAAFLNSRQVVGSDGSDDNGHGTHVSGTMAGEFWVFFWLGLAWLGLAWLGLAWLGFRVLCAYPTAPPVPRSPFSQTPLAHQLPPSLPPRTKPQKNQQKPTAKWGGASGGIAGVLGNAKLANCKMFDAAGNAKVDNAILCIKHLASKNAVTVINNSWGGPGRTQALFETIRDYVCSRGGLFIAAAGNDGVAMAKVEDGDGIERGFYPARFAVEAGAECVIPVAATGTTGRLASFSNFGPDVPIAAPGVSIRSSVWYSGSRTTIEAWDGTSMASPHVSGVALLLKNAFPALTGMQIKQILISTASGSVSGIAGGVLNAEAAYSEAQRVAGAGPPPPPPPVLTCVGTKTLELTAEAGNCDTTIDVLAQHIYSATTADGTSTTADSVSPPVGTKLAAGDVATFTASLAGAGSCSTVVNVVGCIDEQAPDAVRCLSPTYTLRPGQCTGVAPADNELFVLSGGVPGRNARGSVTFSQLPPDRLLGPGRHDVVVQATAGPASCVATVTVQPCTPQVVATTTRAPVRLASAPGTCLASTSSDAAALLVTAATLGRGAVGVVARASRRGSAASQGPLKAGRYSVQVAYPGGVVTPFSSTTVNIGVVDAEPPSVAIKATVVRDEITGFICAVAATARARSACVNISPTAATGVLTLADNCGVSALTRKYTCSGVCPRTLPTARATKICVPVTAAGGRVEATYTMTVTDKGGQAATVTIPIAGYHASQRPAGMTCYSA
jgi:subtilisin family serine protease